MGESSRLETAITVTGLKPGHFYNIRVIAVGPNNFQALSSLIRLRTYGRDGRPLQDHGRSLSSVSTDEDTGDESPEGRRTNEAGVEAIASSEPPQSVAREPSGGNQSQRRNTIGRKHSPSTASALALDQALRAEIATNFSDESMHQLTEKFEAIRKETDELTSQMLRDLEEFRFQMLELTTERDEKKQLLKEKEEASEKLKKEVNYSERANRQAQNRKSQKEKTLREKQAEKVKMHDDLARWKKEIESMKAERTTWEKEKENLEQMKVVKSRELRESIKRLQDSLNGLEEEIHLKGSQIVQLEEQRKNLPGVQDDDDSRLRDIKDKQEDIDWDATERSLGMQLASFRGQFNAIQQTIAQQQSALATLTLQAQSASPFMHHSNSSGMDFDVSNQSKPKSRRTRNRKSRTSTISSPIEAYPINDSPFPSASVYNNFMNSTSPSFAPGPYMDLGAETALVPIGDHMRSMTREEISFFTAGAPLSPSATSLIPSQLLVDDDPPSPRAGSPGSFGPALHPTLGPPAYEDAPQSPDSSSRSPSLISSPQNSSHNLVLYGVSDRDYATNHRNSLNSPGPDFGAVGSPARRSEASMHKGLSQLLNFSRTRGKTMPEEGVILGSLKQGQSQSFPRSTEDPEALTTRHRRISFSSTWNMPSFLQRSSTTVSSSSQGNAPAPARNVGARKRRGFNMFGNSLDEPNLYPDRDPSSPRPLSIASSDFPRPSTDSAPFGWAPTQDGIINRNSPLTANWSIHLPAGPSWGSRNPSRRPSIQQHGSTTNLTTSIATEDDEFLPPADSLAGHSSPPPAIGVIGTRPPSSHKPVTPKLNPTAPAFRGFSFNRASRNDKDKSKIKESAPFPSDDPLYAPNSSSPSESKKSYTHSLHTQNSIAESLDSLDRASSNTPSEMNNLSTSRDKEKEGSTFRQLLRKGSSSKFSMSSFRSKEGGLFSGKKGSGSAANSDRNPSVERDGSFDEYREDHGLSGRSVESITSSPMIGSLESGEWAGGAKLKENTSLGGTPREGRMSVNWGRLGFKKGKNRESVEIEREGAGEGSANEG